MTAGTDPPETSADASPGALRVELDEARRQLAFLHDLLGVAAHDLKNPISALLLGTQRLVRLAGEPHVPQIQALARRLEATVLGMNRAVEGLADLARLGAGRLKLERRRVAAADLLLHAVEAFRAPALERRLELVLDLAPDLPAVECDVERIDRVLAELLGRAVRLSPDGAAIVVRAERHAAGLLTTIADRGPGIPPEVLESLRERRPPPAGARRAHDLGLLLAKGLVEAHRGRFTVESPDGQGCTFRVTLPAAL
ncbi:MAG TPA: HAMP domain-containing sensor histidine kinase [Anaeromyxobacter sp.]|nr:HAMP domain-containing sensor histidine kinase [Anaeromyxobacter sp.]